MTPFSPFYRSIDLYAPIKAAKNELKIPFQNHINQLLEAPLNSYPSGKPTFTMQKLTIPPHTKMPPHSHTIMQLGYILSGELTIVSEEGDTATFHKGEPAIEVVGKIHYGENRGDVDAVVLVISIL